MTINCSYLITKLLTTEENRTMKMNRPPTTEDKHNRFNERFANDENTGVNKLTSTGCMNRFNIHRSEMMLTDNENRQRNFEYANNAEREERRMQMTLWKCFNKLGYKLLDNESADELIERAKQDGNLD
jgi:isochorismate synthase EntC